MRIHIEDLRFNCIIGLHDFERHTPQELVIDLELDYEYRDSFINYADLVALIESNLQEEKYELLETALNALFNLIKQAYPLTQSLQIKITKPDIIPNCRVCVSNIKQF